MSPTHQTLFRTWRREPSSRSARTVLFVGGAQASSTKTTPYQTTRKNSGTPYSNVVKKNSAGVIISYGNTAITYKAPSAALATLGDALFQQNCASCHGTQANGVPANGTNGAYPDPGRSRSGDVRKHPLFGPHARRQSPLR